MSGGGGRKMQGRMGASIAVDSDLSEKDIEKLTAELESLSNDALETRKCKQELKESIANIEKEIAKLQHSMKKAKSTCEVSCRNFSALCTSSFSIVLFCTREFLI